MNKNIYIQPNITVARMGLDELLVSSVPVYNPNESFNNEESVGSRRFNTWDDDEEE